VNKRFLSDTEAKQRRRKQNSDRKRRLAIEGQSVGKAAFIRHVNRGRSCAQSSRWHGTGHSWTTDAGPPDIHSDLRQPRKLARKHVRKRHTTVAGS